MNVLICTFTLNNVIYTCQCCHYIYLISVFVCTLVTTSLAEMFDLLLTIVSLCMLIMGMLACCNDVVYKRNDLLSKHQSMCHRLYIMATV